jgi:HAE1 family hydrophobic/amphiphilic exporter-1
MQKLIRFSIDHLTAVVAMMLIIFLFGLVALRSVPIQMSPDIEKPIMQVRVAWPGASPSDVDREIITRLERELSSLSGVEKSEARSFQGQARLTLTYGVNQDMDKALTLLLSELSSITGLPDDAKQPSVRTSNSDDSPIARLALTVPEDASGKRADIDLENLGRFLQTSILDKLTRVSGVAEVGKYGGGDSEMRVIIDVKKLAIFRLDISTVIEALRVATSQRSVGEIEAGKRNYTIRVESITFTPETAGAIVIRSEESQNGNIIPLRLGDIATIDVTAKKRQSFRRLNGDDAVIINVIREQGTNVVKTMDELKGVIAAMNMDTLAPMGMQLRIVYDETVYIGSAISLVRQNIFIGGLMALAILLAFMRSVIPTIIIFCAIPVSVVGTFVAIAWLGLSINVISLAGLAFAVGMVVDASIISLENIYRLRQKGMPAKEAAYNGARQVWAPILGSALTTVIVFIPVIILKIPVGQLFRDIGMAISVSVLISVFVSVTVIPGIASVLLRGKSFASGTMMALPVIDPLANRLKHFVVGYATAVTDHPRRGVLFIGLVLTLATTAIITFMPKLDYLPDGNSNFVFGRIIVPPGYSIDETKRIAEKMEDNARPLWQGKTEAGGPPAISRFFFVAYGGGAFAGGSTVDPARVKELRMVLMKPIFDVPGASVFVRQSSLFGRSVGGSRSIDIDVMGSSLETIEPIIARLNGAINKRFPRRDGNQIRVRPGLNNSAAQIKIEPDMLALSRAGVTVRDFVNAVDVINDGIVINQIPYNGNLVDLQLTGNTASTMAIDELRALPIIARNGSIIPLADLARIDFVNAPQEIRRSGGQIMMTIQLRPHEGVTLEDSIAVIQNDILPSLSSQLSNNGVSVDISGAASELKQTWQAMQENVLTAIIVIYLLMAILLKSFMLPLIILVVIPVAGAGGLLGLAFLNIFIRQPLDMLTMLGFIILTGVVVNNAILMVEQTVLHIKEDGLSVSDAIIEATSNRIRPIFMSTLTSLFGLLPLVIFPGAGSELYRGIGVVVFGGLGLSTIATLFFIPPLLSVFRRYILATSGSQNS